MGGWLQPSAAVSEPVAIDQIPVISVHRGGGNEIVVATSRRLGEKRNELDAPVGPGGSGGNRRCMCRGFSKTIPVIKTTHPAGGHHRHLGGGTGSGPGIPARSPQRRLWVPSCQRLAAPIPKGQTKPSANAVKLRPNPNLRPYGEPQRTECTGSVTFDEDRSQVPRHAQPAKSRRLASQTAPFPRGRSPGCASHPSTP